MTGRYKVYPEYKDSGVEWLEYLPFNWQIMKVKFLLKDGSEGIKIGPFGSALKLDDMVKKGIRVYGQENVIKRNFTLGKRFISREKYNDMKVYTAEQGDILVTMMGTSGKCQVVPESADLGIIDSHLLKLRTNNRILPELFRLLVDEAQEIKDQIGKQGKGSIMHGLNSTIVKELEFPLPSLKEQVQILNFLKDETAKIDTLITKQEKLIELLKEKRQAVISHAVTKGLNPDAPMKDSGVEWLGEVPEHWGKITFKQVIKTRKGVAFSTSDFCDSGIRVVKASDIKQLSLNQSDVFLPKDFITKYPKAYLTQGNIILSTVGSTPDVRNSAVGQIAMVPQELDKTLLNQNTVVFDPIGNAIDRNYLFFFLQTRAYRDHLDLHAHGTANQASLNVTDMLDFKCFAPSIDEQKLIAMYLYKFLETVSNLETKAVSAIQLMKERKTALISAAVTGKIDVRHFVAEQGKPQGVQG
jgi:type I restriction enzyme, S subunit